MKTQHIKIHEMAVFREKIYGIKYSSQKAKKGDKADGFSS